MSKSRWLWFAIFCFCFFYWACLIAVSGMVIQFDAIGYEDLGRVIYEGGMDSFLRKGPTREPLYPCLVALSMFLSDMWGGTYMFYQKIIQVLLLFSTQIMTLGILRTLRVSKVWQMAAVLYLGVSPGIINGTFSLFSEIGAFLFVALFVWIAAASFGHLLKSERPWQKTFFLAFSSGLVLLLAAFTKAIFIYVFYLFLLPFVFLLLRQIYVRNRLSSALTFLYILVFSCSFLSGVHMWKSANLKYNGNYAFASRGEALFYGNVSKRVRPLSFERLGAHFLSIPGEGVCRKVYPSDLCREASFFGADDFRGAELSLFLENIPAKDRMARLMEISFGKIREHPVRYVIFYVLEFPRMFFWESTRIGFVQYPDWLASLYDNLLFRNGIRLVVSLLTVSGFVFMFFFLVRRRHLFFESSQQGERYRICFFIFWMILTYTALYSMFTIVVRYALPLSPLFIAVVAGWADGIFRRGDTNV